MNKYLYVPTSEISRATQEYLFSIGYRTKKGNTQVDYVFRKYIQVSPEGIICRGNFHYEPLVDVSEISPVDVMFIKQYPVKFMEDGIKVGCTKVDKDTIKKIYDKVFSNV